MSTGISIQVLLVIYLQFLWTNVQVKQPATRQTENFT